ncbi:Puromycin-sensitive aminopeptidase [Thelohanellus kitauei]|uniref:Puromycin-sensitive aminopeptidase n=1 Tax=Thelohanellus kitauei TaxID=669202 RepID=A0A0C2MYE5_THEKT|nr:Puromycin-sensitive aminopeptidase [Thelohanellus kitauei]
MIVTFDSTIPDGVADLDICFQNKIEENLQGIYLTSYIDNEYISHECLVTLFEPNEASSAFPCFDEPALKATFKLRITYLPNKTKIESIENNSNGLTIYSFEKTPKMSTYLLAFVIGDLEYVSKTGASGIRISVYGPINKAKYFEYFLAECEYFVDFYQDFFQVSYPLEKLDLVAVPSSFAGGMENRGLITFRDQYLYFDQEYTSGKSKRWNNLGIAHEIAHQWFGNLVTMKWWTDIWLNEGFASWIMYVAVDKVFPEHRIWKHFYSTTYAVGLEYDSYFNSHPVEIDSELPSYLLDAFDTITYSKGASLINFMSHFVGHQYVRDGLREYMSKFKFGNVSTSDLWDCLEKASGKTVSRIMGSFTRQTGYPILRVELEHSSDCSSNYTLKIRQERYLLQGGKDIPPQIWVLPIDVDCVRTSDVLKSGMLLEKDAEDLIIASETELQYVLVNPKRAGFCRVFYSEPLYDMLVSHLKELEFEDRFGLLCDYYSFARSGYIGTDRYLDLIIRFSEIDEDDEEIWRAIIASLNEIHSLVFYSPDYKNISHKFKELYSKLLASRLSKYKFHESPPTLRPRIKG